MRNLPNKEPPAFSSLCPAMVFEGEITLLAPYTTSPPKVGAGFMPRMSIMFAAGGERRMMTTMYLPGAQLRNAWRSGATHIAMEALRDHPDNPVAPHAAMNSADWLFNLTARAPSSAVSRNDIAATLRRRAANPVVGLFGDFGLRGASSVEHAVPYEPYDPQAGYLRRGFDGARFDSIRAAPGILAELAPGSEDEWRKMMDGQADRSEARGELRNVQKEIDAIRTEARNERRDLSADEKTRLTALEKKSQKFKKKEDAINSELGAEASTSQTIEPIEYLPQGMVLRHRMSLVSPSALEFDLFVAAIGRFFATDARRGARAALGFGTIEARYTVKAKRDLAAPPVVLGTIHGRPFEGVSVDAAETADGFNPLSAKPATGPAFGAALAALRADPWRYDFSMPDEDDDAPAEAAQ